jgi:undecaprenyl-diphosphatase
MDSLTDMEVVPVVTLLSVIILLYLFIVLSKMVLKGRCGGIDSGFSRAITASRRGGDIYTLFSTITHLGSLKILLPAIVAISLVAIREGESIEALYADIFFLTSVLCVYAVKYVIDRKRPRYGSCIVMPSDPSYPSAHTLQIFSFTLMVVPLCIDIFSLDPFWVMAIFISLSVTVALSRIYLGVHFASDVAGGVILASLWSAVEYLFGSFGGNI